MGKGDKIGKGKEENGNGEEVRRCQKKSKVGKKSERKGKGVGRIMRME